MPDLLDQYVEHAGTSAVDHLRQLAKPLAGLKVIHVNSTKEGGGVAEILHKLIPLKQALGIDASWDVISGSPLFYQCTKTFHNALQGEHLMPSQAELETYEAANEDFASTKRKALEEADVVFIHDPQPAAVASMIPNRRGKWVWRCHIDASHPFHQVWRYLRRWLDNYDASIFSLPQFARRLPHAKYIIAPSIDPLTEKNMDLPEADLEATRLRFGLDPTRPLAVQVSRFDRFKDPLGVIAAYRLARRFNPLQLVLVGGSATDDPEGAAILEEVRQAAADDPDIHVLLLPPDAHREINALQRCADIVLQKSTKEGFGLTVSEALWKGKPVIGGDVGGIRLQVIDHFTGFRVRTPEGAALRLRYLLSRPKLMEEMGQRGRRHVRENFLLTRHLREYLTLIHGLMHGSSDRIELFQP
jgi:trehalose synthase